MLTSPSPESLRAVARWNERKSHYHEKKKDFVTRDRMRATAKRLRNDAANMGSFT